MVKRHRTTPLLRLLARLGWQRDPDLWTVHFRDGHGRHARILVHLSAAGVCLTVPDQGPLQLSVTQSAQLRVALRDAFSVSSSWPARRSWRSPGAPSP